jgi:hypothetical protein
MTACDYQQKNCLFDDKPGIDALKINEPETKTFKCYMGTFLLRRAHYFSETWHKSSCVAG